jgi:hypothetical protein
LALKLQTVLAAMVWGIMLLKTWVEASQMLWWNWSILLQCLLLVWNFISIIGTMVVKNFLIDKAKRKQAKCFKY